ncbi:glycosyl hydrolase family 28-related protein [Kitasatospora sp. NPDC088134]|uniref:glycosyl hydrolase family 28-related protein n=1 Tax=Kitasatospora sp. NPDC088134 TaxID=3364071 RepID=UPI0037F4128C
MTTRRNLLRAAAAGAGLGAAATLGTGTAEAAAQPGLLNVRTDYGAQGDGTADDTVKLQQALDAARPGDVVLLPNGNYRISAPLTVPSGVRVQGSGSSWYSGGGQNETVINAAASFSGAQLVRIGGATGPNSTAVSIRDLTLRAADAPAGQALVGLEATGAVSQLLLENVQVTQTGGSAIRLAAAGGSAPTGVRFHQVATWKAAGNGFELDVRDAQFSQCLAFGSGLSGWRFTRSSNNQLVQCRSEHSGRHGFEWTDDQPIGGVVFTACTTDQNLQDGFHLERIGGGAAVQFDGCCARRDGSTDGGRFSGFSVAGCTAAVLLTGTVVTAFRSDGKVPGTDRYVESPYYGLTVTGSASVGVQAAALSTAAGGRAVNWDGQGSLSTGPNLVTGEYANNATGWRPAPDGLRSGPGQLSFASADTVTPLLDPSPHPADQGLLTWSFDPSALGSTGVPATGVLQLVRVLLRTPQQVTAAVVAVTSAGSGLTVGQNLVGLYGANGVQLAAGGDQSAAWSSTGVRTAPLTPAPGAPAVLPAGAYWVALLANGATPPGFGRGSFVSTSAINLGLPGAPPRYGRTGSGLTALPGQLAFDQATEGTSAFWVALR